MRLLKTQGFLQIKEETLRNERRELQKRNRLRDLTYFDKLSEKNLDFLIDTAQKRKLREMQKFFCQICFPVSKKLFPVSKKTCAAARKPLE